MGEAKSDVLTRISKSQLALNQMGGIWRTNVVSTNTKVKMSNCTIESVLLCGAKNWKVDKETMQKLQTFINKSLRKILKIHWPDKINNIELGNKTKQELVETTLKRRKWNWIGHALRKANDNIVRQALEHQPVEKRKKCTPLNARRS
jgi:hypothetical protein